MPRKYIMPRYRSEAKRSAIVNLDIGQPYHRLVMEKERARQAIANAFSIHPASVFPTIGATHAIDRILSEIEARSPSSRKALVPSLEYWRAAERITPRFRTEFFTANGEPNYKVETKAFLSRLRRVQPHLVYVSYPNNPTGNLHEIERMIEVLPERTTIVIDTTLLGIQEGAPIDLRPKIAQWLKNPDKRIVVVGSLSKSHDVAHDRFGWLLTTNPQLQEALHSTDSVFPPIQTLRNGRRLVSKSFVASVARRIVESHRLLKENASQLGFEYLEGDTQIGYALLRLKPKTKTAVKRKIARAGIKIAPGEKFGLPTEFVRIEVGEPSKVRRLLSAMRKR